MFRILTAAFLLLNLNATWADSECKSRYWTLHGQVGEEVANWDKFLTTLPPDPTAALNAYIHKRGLLLQLRSPNGSVMGYDNFLIGEGRGLSVGLFLKYMRLIQTTNVAFDTIYEVERPDSNRAIWKWSVPYGSPRPTAVQAFEIIYREKMSGVCAEVNRTVPLAVSTEGIYRAISRDKFPEITPIAEVKCNAQRALFKDSTTAACGEFKDLESGHTRILVWDARIK